MKQIILKFKRLICNSRRGHLVEHKLYSFLFNMPKKCTCHMFGFAMLLAECKVKKHREENLIAKVKRRAVRWQASKLTFYWLIFTVLFHCCMPNRMDFSPTLVNLQETSLFSQPSTLVCTYTDKPTAQTTNFITTHRLDHENKTGKHPG